MVHFVRKDLLEASLKEDKQNRAGEDRSKWDVSQDTRGREMRRRIETHPGLPGTAYKVNPYKD